MFLMQWGKISKAYQILADDSSRFIYDYYGTIDNSLEDKASFNPYVGGELWQPYIGNLEIGFWSLSFINNELKILASTVQKKRRHGNRMSSIVRYLQDKLFRFPEFPEQDDSSQFEINLYEEAKKLSAEPNGKKLLFTLGKIYTDEAKTYLNKSSTVYSKYFSSLKERLEFFINFTLGYLMIRTKNNPDLEETNKLVWNLSKSEISSIVREACEKVLHDENRSEVESYHLANSMLLLGKTWLEVSEW
ncbi:unnamed protein product [Rhizophagus irregularis]|uniref:DNAJ-containing protein X-domain domain-containing protein n=1 Tax=Rhizophagus irregularis TaxID=588596 RepID=A0A2N1NHP6_9GLOM|nr:hypothetical protein RhiirC2_776095 [Rhizophagus irregularis]CAB5388551.1 unnamed protein product [Rhizophagus irregularis]